MHCSAVECISARRPFSRGSCSVTALALVYRGPLLTDAGSFVGLTYFGLPWLLVHSGCGAYTAYGIARRV
jgi:hypothetical protein